MIMPDHPWPARGLADGIYRWPYAVRHWVESRFGCLDHEATVNAMLVGDTSRIVRCAVVATSPLQGSCILFVVSRLHRVSLISGARGRVAPGCLQADRFSQVRRIYSGRRYAHGSGLPGI